MWLLHISVLDRKFQGYLWNEFRKNACTSLKISNFRKENSWISQIKNKMKPNQSGIDFSILLSVKLKLKKGNNSYKCIVIHFCGHPHKLLKIIINWNNWKLVLSSKLHMNILNLILDELNRNVSVMDCIKLCMNMCAWSSYRRNSELSVFNWIMHI